MNGNYKHPVRIVYDEEVKKAMNIYNNDMNEALDDFTKASGQMKNMFDGYDIDEAFDNFILARRRMKRIFDGEELEAYESFLKAIARARRRYDGTPHIQPPRVSPGGTGF